MENIYSNLYNIFRDVFTTSENVYTIPKPAIRDFIFIRYGIEIKNGQRCSLKYSIDMGNGNEVPIIVVFLDKEQTEQFKDQKSFNSYSLVETYVGTPNHIIIYIPEPMMYINNDYSIKNRIEDLVNIISPILVAYYRSNMILQSEYKTMTVYAPITIAVKVLMDVGIIDDSLRNHVIELKNSPVVLQIVDEIKDNSIEDLLVNKYIREILK